MKIGAAHIKYIHDQMDRVQMNNVSIYLPELSAENIKQLRKHFKSVRKVLVGYVKFERADKVIGGS